MYWLDVVCFCYWIGSFVAFCFGYSPLDFTIGCALLLSAWNFLSHYILCRLLDERQDFTHRLFAAAEMLWVVVSNVSDGDWTKQSEDWQTFAANWRDNYFKVTKLTP